MSVITAVTAQNTVEVRSIQPIDTGIIVDQMAVVFEDIKVDAVKIGMLGSIEVIDTVADQLKIYQPTNIVLDPVMIAKSGDRLLSEDAIATLKTKLLPLATLITPNLPEAEALTGMKIETKQDIYTACQQLQTLGRQKRPIKRWSFAR